MTPASRAAPILVGCSHGTASIPGQHVVRDLLDEVRSARPGLDVTQTYVDVQHPQVSARLASLPPGRPAIVVPLLLSGGYHTSVDIAQAVSGRPHTVAAPCLGPDPRLVPLLSRRIREAGGRAGDSVVLAAAGSSDPRSLADVEAMAAQLATQWPGPVSIGYGSIASPSVTEAVAKARRTTVAAKSRDPRLAAHLSPRAARVIIAAYLLAPGHFHDRLSTTGGDAVTVPLAPDPVLAEIVLDRYDALRKAPGVAATAASGQQPTG